MKRGRFWHAGPRPSAQTWEDVFCVDEVGGAFRVWDLVLL